MRFTLLLTGLLLIALSAYAAPNLINYQGVLTDGTGGAVSGVTQLSFVLFDADASGVELWTEGQAVTVENGTYNVLLGAVTPFPPDLFTGDSLWLEVRVGPPGNVEVLSPRQQLVSVPYAQSADHAVNAEFLSGVDVTGFGSATDIAAAQAEINNLQSTVAELQTVITSLGPQAPVGGNGNVQAVTRYHGMAMLNNLDAQAGKALVNVAVTSASASVDGTATVDFSVSDKDALPVTDLTGALFTIARLEPPAGGESFSRWVPYIYQAETVTGNEFPNPSGTQADQAFYEMNGVLTNHGDGSYNYVFATNLSSVVTPVAAEAVGYDRTRMHRIAVLAGGLSGPTGDAVFDFVPDGSPLVLTRNIVTTEACQKCHGLELPAHDGTSRSVESCVTCHAPRSLDAQSGESLDFKVLIHKIHAGGELPTIPGPDGIVWDDPATPTDESADNGTYALWGDNNVKHSWWKSRFPAVLANCAKCHQGVGAEVDNWKTVPSRDACGSCHDQIDFAVGTNHLVSQANDTVCTACHPSEGSSTAVTDAHDWTVKDERNIPEFTVDMSLSTPGNGVYFVAGETPVVSLVIKENGTSIDHTTVVQDLDGPEGCVAAPCPPRDGGFYAARLFVAGPRGKQNPVLSTAARVEILSISAGPFDLSSADNLGITFDSGKDILTRTSTAPAYVRVTAAGAFTDMAAVTASEIVNWLNANSSFSARGIAYLEGGQVAIRSRNLGDFYSIQLDDDTVTTAVFGGDTSIHVLGSFYPSNNIYQYVSPSQNDPKVTWFTDHIEYVLDPVDDLTAGTYVVSAAIADRGRVSSTNYKTPSVAKLPFQVKTVDEELPPARNCDSCHQGPDGRGFVADLPRHYKILDDLATDQCGACHDYQSGHATGPWYGSQPLSKRIHAIHYGSKLNYPTSTVASNDYIPGRYWDIEYSQDVLHCESCHPEGTSSGSWAVNANRLACLGCHDSDSAQTHVKLETYDPTPDNPWSGDELESCQTCH
jgi:OmcA/MtrC family decaheme c-type cytochrome